MIQKRRKPIALALALVTFTLAACDDEDNGTEPPAPLTAPTVTATAQGQTTIVVSWNSVSGATSYTVERAQGATGGTFAQVAAPSTTSYTDSNLTAGTTYRYRVRATSATNQSDFSAEASATTEEEPAGPMEATISADITSNRTLYADTTYTISGFVKVANGAILTIEPGTRILGATDPVGSSLFVLRGAQIRAMGTADEPIVFTSSEPAGSRRPGDWGGLILVGNGVINRTAPVILEGTEGFAAPIDYAGGTNNADDSGELHYVRVEFAGFATQPNAELNSFTFAAVGSGTEMDHLQALAGLDDNFEWFGGAADGRYLVSYESGDDHFDMSEGFQGRLQYLIGYQSKVLEPRPNAGSVSSDPQGIENDGCGGGASCPDGQDSEPLNIPMVANFTLVGTGPGVIDNSGGIGMLLRRGTGGYYVNGLIARWPTAAISLRDEATTGARITEGNLAVRNILAADNGTLQQGGDGRFQIDAEANDIEQVAVAAASLFQTLPAAPTAPGDFDWRPAEGSAALEGGLATFDGDIATKAGTFITGTAFRGAAPRTGDNSAWWTGWTNYASN